MVRSNLTQYFVRPDPLFKQCWSFGLKEGTGSSTRCVKKEPSARKRDITCGFSDRHGRLHKGPEYCEMKWISSKNEFKIWFKDLQNISKHSFSGMLECKLKNTYSKNTNIYKTYFLAINDQKTASTTPTTISRAINEQKTASTTPTTISRSLMILPIILFLAFVTTLLLVIWKFRKKDHKSRILEKWK